MSGTSLVETLTLSPSQKVIGRYEKPLIETLTKHFIKLGYSAFPHVRLNVAWSPIVSDIDLLAVRHGEITIIEVKSSHDKFSRALSQLQQVVDFTDFAFVATDRVPTSFASHIGLLLVEDDKVQTLVESRMFNGRPQQESLFKLQKKCLRRLVMASDDQMSKYEMSDIAYVNWDANRLRECVKQIVTCDRDCEGNCPIRRFTQIT